jgi:peptidoglycan/xylan/chitin deacetylase (PgdA/CDA1 family)
MLRVFMLVTAVLLTAAAGARATECPGNPNALGTSRTIVVDPIEHPRIGTMQYRETLPLDDHEVVITFDDGPIPPRSTKVLEILASECVKATFFLVGEMARAHPEAVRQIEAAGHTIGTHSETHPLTFHKMPEAKAEQQINAGITSVASVLNDRTRLAPFFRIPGFLRRDSVEQYLASQHLMTWCADFPADDWMKISPDEVVKRALERLEDDGKGILLLHDIHPRTVEALAVILSELKRRGYRIVHVVPASPEQPRTATDPRQWVMHPHSIWPLPVVYELVEPSLPAPGVAMFDGRPDTALSRPRSHAVARGQVPLPPVPMWPRVPDEPSAEQELSKNRSLPAPAPESFVLTAEAPVSWEAHRPGFPVVPDVKGTSVVSFNMKKKPRVGLPQLAMHDRFVEDGSTARMPSVALPQLAIDSRFVEDGSTHRWPIAAVPNGAIP